MDLTSIRDQLDHINVRPTVQRIKILEFLHKNHIHPTADEIFQNLSHEIPSLSKTTVYNTLRTLVENNIIHEIKINEAETRYDIEIEPHGHFQCTGCGKIFNFDIDMDDVNPKDLKNFRIDTKTINLSGLCPDCLSVTDQDDTE